jgi:uracil-DNA glycosylase
LCYDFFRTQLEKINPKTIICLGVEVGQTLSEYSNLFKTFSKKHSTITNLYADNSKADYIINIDDNYLGQRKFILIPHPSYGHINWKKNDIINKIIKSIN